VSLIVAAVGLLMLAGVVVLGLWMVVSIS